LAAVASKKSEMDELGVQMMAISTNSHFVHKVWQDTELSKMVEGGFPWPMVADGTGAIGKAYGVYDEAAGVDIRGRFIIDPDGVIQAMEVLTPTVGRNVQELIRQVKAFQHVRATGEVTPSGWQPGKPTLKPGPALVGAVWKEWKVEEAF
jgi:peroxiredoxin (alkyl hydroperoxide reductase subunit C)